MTKNMTMLRFPCGTVRGIRTAAMLASALFGLTDAAASEQKLLRRVSRLEHPPLRESSGIVASRRHKGVYWTHNDSGNPPVIYAIRRDGSLIAEFSLGVPNRDWEDIAADETGHLYIGEIGNNPRARRPAMVYQIKEPNPMVPVEAPLEPSATWELQYPGEPFDSEGLMIHKGWGYLVSKASSGKGRIYRFPLDRRVPVLLEEIAALPKLPPITGSDISSDGKHVVLIANTGVFLFQIDSNMTRLTKATPSRIRFVLPGVEACCFIEGGVLATSELRGVFFFAKDALMNGGHEYVPPVELRIIAVEERPNIDGDLDDWNLAAGELTLKSIPSKGKRARIWGRWSEHGLYLAASVPDDRVSPLSDPWYRGDTIEVFIGRHAPDRSPDYEVGDDRCYLGFARNPDGSCGELEIHWPRRLPVPEAKVAGRINPKESYQVEMFIPSSVTGSGIGAKDSWEAGGQIRLNVSIVSKKPRRDWYISSPNHITRRGPIAWGIATLVEGSRPRK